MLSLGSPPDVPLTFRWVRRKGASPDVASHSEGATVNESPAWTVCSSDMVHSVMSVVSQWEQMGAAWRGAYVLVVLSASKEVVLFVDGKDCANGFVQAGFATRMCTLHARSGADAGGLPYHVPFVRYSPTTLMKWLGETALWLRRVEQRASVAASVTGVQT